MTDIGLENEDWLRASEWDVYKLDHSGPVDRLGDLVVALDLPAREQDLKVELRRLVALPFWRTAPQRLKDETEQFLADN